MRSGSRGLPASLLLGLCLWLQRWASPWVFSVARGPRGAGAHPAPQQQWVFTRREELEHVDRAVACMLLGSISFVMGLFYLVNHRDEDIRRYSWEVLSTTLAIFTSVLIFQGMDGILVHFILQCLCPHGASERHLDILVVSTVHFLIWFVALHVVVARMAFVMATTCNKEDEKEVEAWERGLKCWATLLSHMTAFAAIAAWCDVQHIPVFARSPLAAAAPVVLYTGVLFALFRFTGFLRNRVFSKEGLEDPILVWEEEAEEGENDLAAISISFLTVYVVRYAISGVMGDQKGPDVADGRAALLNVPALVAASFFFLAVMFSVVRFILARRVRRAVNENDEVPTWHSWKGFDSMQRYRMRWGYIILDAAGMSFAWCLLYASKWTVVHLSHVLALPLAQTETIGGICVALCTSVLACLMVFGINWICDQRQLHEVMRKQFRTIIRCLGLLIGFAWEQSFDSGVEAVAMLAEPMGTWPPLLAKFFLACVVAVVVIPAWKLHILKTVMAVRSQGS